MIKVESASDTFDKSSMSSEFSVELEGAMTEQGGGHGRINKCIVNPGNIKGIAKPLDHRESGAYDEIKKTPLSPCVPEYFGNHILDGVNMLVIRDTTAGMTSPCLADLKVGTRHYDLTASDEKRIGLIEKAKNSTTPTLGVRVIDAKIRQHGQVVKSWDRKQGLQFTEEEFIQVVKDFLPGKKLSEFHTEIVKIRDAYAATMKAYPGFRVYASSILISYDGDKPIIVKLIDFAHLYIDIGAEGVDISDPIYDDGVLGALESLCRISSEF